MTQKLSRWILKLTTGLLFFTCIYRMGDEAHAAPQANALEAARAQRISAMPDETPPDRINQLLAARDFNETELFVLAGTHPGIVEHFIREDLRLGTNYLFH